MKPGSGRLRKDVPTTALGFRAEGWQYANAFLEAERRGVNQASFTKRCCNTNSVVERGINFQLRERFDAAGDESFAEVGVRRNFPCGDARDSVVIRKIDRVGNHRRRCICRRRAISQNRDGVCDAKRKASAAPAAGGDATNRFGRSYFQVSEQRRILRPFDHVVLKGLAITEMYSDVAAIVYISAIKIRGRGH